MEGLDVFFERSVKIFKNSLKELTNFFVYDRFWGQIGVQEGSVPK
jgi:hypothetical protein